MRSFLPSSIQKVIEEFSKLPGIGPKSAQRLAMHLLYSPESRSHGLADAIGNLKNGLQFCRICWNIAEGEICRICSDPQRNQEQICVVEEILDVLALEKTAEYLGVYHVLHGVLSPVDAIGPEQLKIQELLTRVEKIGQKYGGFRPGGGNGEITNGSGGSEKSIGLQKNTGPELILATNPSLEGETTAMYLKRLLQPKGLRITRIARGLPAGGDLDYADELTLTRALAGRAEYE